MRPSKLSARYVSGAGCEIFAEIAKPVNCVEFTLKAGEQPIAQGNFDKPELMHDDDVLHIIGYEPFIQFPAKEWRGMIEQTFIEMVEAWNEKYAQKFSHHTLRGTGS